jgi:ketosteroid isomerase-like protein
MIGAIIAKKLAPAGLDALNRRDLDAFMASWAENGTYVLPGDLSVSGVTKGKKAIRELFQKYLDTFPVINFTVLNVCVQNIFALGGTNVIAVEWKVNYKNRNGEEFENSGATIIHVKKGKIVLVREYLFDVELEKRAWGEAKS